MADAAYEGVFYSFESKAQFDALVAKVKAKCDSTEDGCEIYRGQIRSNGIPRYLYRHRAPVYDLRRLIFQAANPSFVPTTTFNKIECSCGNTRCLSADHLKVIVREEWNVDEIRKRIVAGCTRGPVPKGLEVGCMLWNGCTAEGYGMFHVDGSTRRVHSVALLIHEGKTEPPLGEDGKPLQVRHKCSIRHCCEVTHLEWGNPKQNGEDRVRDGTSGLGEASPMAKMSNETASAVKMSWRPRGDPEYMTMEKRAEKFGVTVGMVSTVDREVAWKHLPGPSNKPAITRETPEKPRITRDDLDEEIMKKLVSRIKAKVKITPGMSKDPSIKTPCHIFTGGKSKGYGLLTYMSLGLRTHVVVHEHNMKIRTPEGLVVRHRCGVKDCCAPDHLTFGAQTHNWLDSVTHGDIKHKFSIEDIKRIRKIPITDRDAIRKEAEDNDVRFDYIQAIINKRVWAMIK